MHIVRDVTNIVGLGWQLKGNILGLNFQLFDEHGEVIAVIAQKLFSIHDKYCIDIYKPEHEKTVIAILITLQHMIKDREASSKTILTRTTDVLRGVRNRCRKIPGNCLSRR